MPVNKNKTRPNLSGVVVIIYSLRSLSIKFQLEEVCQVTLLSTTKYFLRTKESDNLKYEMQLNSRVCLNLQVIRLVQIRVIGSPSVDRVSFRAIALRTRSRGLKI